MPHIDIKTRLSAGSYHASATGYAPKASASMSGDAAAQALLTKLHPGCEVLSTELLQAGWEGAPRIVRYHLKLAEGD